MRIVARAPGKLVLLGEYAVLDGVAALVMAVGRHVVAEIEPVPGPRSALMLRTDAATLLEFSAGEPTGAALVDEFIRTAPPIAWPAWRGRLDSGAFWLGETKLGLGSSAAALAAWAGVWSRAAGSDDTPDPAELITVHRRFQGGAGSGLDVACSCRGGVLEYRLDAEFVPHFGSVRLPNSVGFAGIFAGSSASTADLVGRYRQWQRAQPAAARPMLAAMADLAADGAGAVSDGDGDRLMAAMAAYGDCLDRLGRAMGVDLVTSQHREIGSLARRFNVAYKVSGAGGGDLGIAASADPGQLSAFRAAVGDRGYRVIDITPDQAGLEVEEIA